MYLHPQALSAFESDEYYLWFSKPKTAVYSRSKDPPIFSNKYYFSFEHHRFPSLRGRKNFQICNNFVANNRNNWFHKHTYRQPEANHELTMNLPRAAIENWLVLVSRKHISDHRGDLYIQR